MNAPEPAVRREDHGAVRVLLLNRPGRRNALDMAMRTELVTGIEEATADSAVRALVLTGAGGCFCAGGDLSSMRRQTPAESRPRLEAAQRVARAIVECPMPVVAAVEGYAIGAGLGIAAACDQVVAATNARFSASFLTVGLGADLGVSWSLPRRIGTARARTMLLTGSRLDGRQALDCGLVDHLVEPTAALDGAAALAARFAEGPPLALAAVKDLFSRPAGSVDEVLQAELHHQSALFDTADFAEGLTAMKEKRAPVFIGK